MLQRLTWRGALAALCLVIPMAIVQAAVVKTLKIDSVPAGAEVFLLQGSKETRIGTTPFRYSAEFHSEVSVLRLMARKAGYEPKQVEIKAGEDRAVIRLSGRAFAAAPKGIQDPRLRSLQASLVPAIEKVAPQALKVQQPFQLDLPGAIRVQKVGPRVYLVVPVTLLSGPHEFNEIGARDGDAFLRELWSQLDGTLAAPLAQAARDAGGLDGILLDAEYSHLQRGFNVGVKTESHIEMECQAGMREQQVFDTCASQTMVSHYDATLQEYVSEMQCQSGMVSRSVYDACATRVPVTHTELVADPQVLFDRAKSTARYTVGMKALLSGGSPQDVYGKIGATLKDKDGNVIAGNGDAPGN